MAIMRGLQKKHTERIRMTEGNRKSKGKDSVYFMESREKEWTKKETKKLSKRKERELP
jgi:hypothetical protein